MNGNELADDCSLLRMVWSPRCFDVGPTVACFDRKDIFPETGISGKERFVSADCELEIVKAVVDARIAWQTRGGLREKEKRHDARFIRLLCGALRNLPEKEAGRPNPLRVERDPVLALPENGFQENPAHCAIRNMSPNSRTGDKAANRLYVDYLRKELLKLIVGVLEYAAVLPDGVK